MDMQKLMDMLYGILEQRRGAKGNVLAQRQPSPLESAPAPQAQAQPTAQPTPEDALTDMQLRARTKRENYEALANEDKINR